jgi:antitoxin MazE
MNLQITKWGNSLAVRIPAEMARGVGLIEGDIIQAALTAQGGIFFSP